MVGPPAAQPPSRSRSGSKLEPKTKHRLTGSVSDVPYSPEDLSSGDAPGNGNPTSGAASSASLKDRKTRRRTRSSLGGTEDLIKELDTLAPRSNKLGSRESTPTPPTTPPAGVRSGNTPLPGTEYTAPKAKPSDPDEDLKWTPPIILSGSESVTGESSVDKESVTSVPKVTSSGDSNQPTLQGNLAQVDSFARAAVSHPDVVELETQGGSAVQLKAGAYSTNEDSDLWICRQCGWTYPNAHPSAKHRRNHKKVCEKIYTGVEVPPGSSDDASSDDELNSKVDHADQVDQVINAGSSTTIPRAHVKADAKDEPVKHPGAVQRTFTKPTISTGSESSKNSPVNSPGKRDSPFTSPAKRDSHLSSPAKKETPWGSPIRRSTPVSSPSSSKKVSSPITSPVKRIMSTPVKRNSPPRPDGITRTLTAKQQQEEEERKISVKKRIEELERIAGSKPHTWKEYVADGKKSGELSSSGSPLRHGEEERRKSGEMSPGGKPLKHVESVGRKSADSSPTIVSGKPLRHVPSSKRSGELSSTGSPLTHSVDGKSSRTPQNGEVAKLQPAVSEDQRSAIHEATITLPTESSAADGGKVAAPETVGTEGKMSLESEAEMWGSTGHHVKASVESEDTASVKDGVTDISGVKVPYGNSDNNLSVENVQVADAAIVSSAEKVQAAGENTVLIDEIAEEESTEVFPKKEGPSQDEGAKQETGTASHSRGPSLVLDKRNTSLLTVAEVPEDSELDKPSGQVVDVENVQKEVRVPEVITSTESGLKEGVTPLDTENAIANKEALNVEDVEAITISPVQEQSGPDVAVDTLSSKEQGSSEVAAPVAVEERAQYDTSSKPGDPSDAPAAEMEGNAEAVGHKVALPHVVSVEPVADQTASSKVSSETSIIKSSESDNAVGNVSPSLRPVDHDDDTSVLLTKQPAVDPLFVDSQQDRLWEMHSQELTRRDGETSGADVRESSAQDDDPIQYVNGSPLAPEASGSGTTSNGNGVNEKGGKVDRPRTPLRSLIAEDDAADKGGDEGAPTGKETPIVSPRGNLFKRIVSGGKASPTKPSTPSMYEKKSHSKPFLSSCICCSPVK